MTRRFFNMTNRMERTRYAARALICVLVSFLMILGCCACANTGDTDAGTTGSTTTTTASTTVSTSVDNNPTGDSDKQTTGGSNAVTTTTVTKATGTTGKTEEVVTEGKTFLIASELLPTKVTANSTLFEKLFWQRAKEVEKELGCKIVVSNALVSSSQNLAPLIMAGKKVGNIVELEIRYLVPLIAAGYLRPWDEVPNINVNDSDYTAGLTKAATIKGKHWGLQFQKPPGLRAVVIVNKTRLKQNGIDPDSIYTLMDQGKWTWDTFLDYAKKTTDAAAGKWGVMGYHSDIVSSLLMSNNARLVTVSGNKATPSYTSSNVVETLNFINRMKNTDKVYSDAGEASSAFIDEFVKGNVTFLMTDAWVINQKIRPKVRNFDYGIVSIPKGPQGKDTYFSPAQNAGVFTVTSTNKELDFTAKVFNALKEPPAGYSGDQWWADELQLDYFQNNDTKSVEVYKKMLNASAVDFGLCFGIDDASITKSFMEKTVIGPILKNSGMTPQAAVDSIKGTFDKRINDLFSKLP